MCPTLGIKTHCDFVVKQLQITGGCNKDNNYSWQCWLATVHDVKKVNIDIKRKKRTTTNDVSRHKHALEVVHIFKQLFRSLLGFCARDRYTPIWFIIARLMFRIASTPFVFLLLDVVAIYVPYDFVEYRRFYHYERSSGAKRTTCVLVYVCNVSSNEFQQIQPHTTFINWDSKMQQTTILLWFISMDHLSFSGQPKDKQFGRFLYFIFIQLSLILQSSPINRTFSAVNDI